MVAVGSAVIGNGAPLLTDLDAVGSVELVQVQDELRAVVLGTGFEKSSSDVELRARK